MPTFLDNSLAALNRGYDQVYGQPAVGTSPATPVSAPPQAISTPVNVNPNVAGSPDMAIMVPMSALFSGAPVGGPAPISYNPEVGQTLGADGSAAGTQGFWGWLQNLFSGGGQQSQPASTNASTLDANAQVGPPTPTMPQAAQTTGGVATDSPGIDAANAANTSFGGGGMSGGQIGSSILGGIGSGLSKIGQGISNTKASYTPPNIPLPSRAVFSPPNLSPNTKSSY